MNADIKKPLVYVVETDYAIMHDAVGKVFHRFPLEVKGKLVWVKPNMLGNFNPDKHVTTHPSLVSAVVDKLISLGAKVVVGDNSGVPSLLSEDNLAKENGILDASKGNFRVISREVVDVKLGGGINETVAISKIAKECDVMISLPKMKTHLHTFLTGAIKNSYGLVVGVQKPNLHRKYPKMDDFAKIIAEVYDLRKPDLVIVDGVVALEGDGPNSPNTHWVGRVIASQDGVALDHYIARIMGMDPSTIPLLTYCVASGMGSAEYHVEGNERVIEKFLLPKTYFEPRNRQFSFVEELIYRYVTRKSLRVIDRKCVRCLRCVEVCASKAICVQGKYPVIDNKKCILCYCCKEVCPNNAIRFPASYSLAQKMIWLWERVQNIVRPKKG